MLDGRVDLGDDNLVEIRSPSFDAFDFDPRHREQFRQLVDARWQRNELAKPINGEFHIRGAHAPRVLVSAPPPKISCCSSVRSVRHRAMHARARALPGKKNTASCELP